MSGGGKGKLLMLGDAPTVSQVIAQLVDAQDDVSAVMVCFLDKEGRFDSGHSTASHGELAYMVTRLQQRIVRTVAPPEND